MTVQKKLLPLALLIALVFPAFAQNATLDSVCASLAKNKVTCGNFVQEKKVNERRTLRSNGTFVLSTEGIALNTLKPLKTGMAVTPHSYIQVNADGSRSVLDASGNDVFRTVSQSVIALLNGDREVLEKNFDVSFSSDSATWTMNLTPLDQTVASAMESVTLGGRGNAEDCVLEYFSMGDSVKYTFSGHVYKNELSKEEKAFFAK